MKKRYAAELMFFYDKKKSGKRIQKKKICERRIFILMADSDAKAYRLALDKGVNEEFTFSDQPYEVDYKFLGIREMISLAGEEDDVVWYEFEERLEPERRVDEFIPDKNDLRIFKSPLNKNKMTLLGG